MLIHCFFEKLFLKRRVLFQRSFLKLFLFPLTFFFLFLLPNSSYESTKKITLSTFFCALFDAKKRSSASPSYFTYLISDFCDFTYVSVCVFSGTWTFSKELPSSRNEGNFLFRVSIAFEKLFLILFERIS